MDQPNSRAAGSEEERGGRTVVIPPDVPRSPYPWSPAIRAGGWVFAAGRTATDYETAMAADVGFDPANPYMGKQLELESRYVFDNLTRTLAAAGADLRRDLARLYVWVQSPHPTYDEFLQGSSTTGVHIHDYLLAFNAAMDEPRPASAALGIRELIAPGNRIGVDLIAIPGPEPQGYEFPPELPSPVAKYSPAIRRGDWIFLAGDLATDFQGDFKTTTHMGEPSAVAPEARVNPYMWYGSSIEAQTDYLLSKLEKIAESAGSSLADCVKADVYFGHPQDLEGIDRVWRKWFPENPPARGTIPYCGLAARGCRIEISMALLHRDSQLTRETVETSAAPEPRRHEPQAVKAGNFLFLSTQLPVDSTGAVPKEMLHHPELPYLRQPPKLQTSYMLGNIAAICEAAGTSLENLCRCQMFFDDFADLPASVDEWASHFPADPPVATPVRLGGPLIVPGAHALYDTIAYIPG
jgi:enamine deaminase RidA (YjgF/YER057c/UK114 family)